MLIALESPWAGLGAGEKAAEYLRNCIRDAIANGEIPWASHAMLAHTRALYEEDEEQRAEGIEICKNFIKHHADYVVAYVDHGISSGMKEAIRWARMHGKEVKFRRIYPYEPG